MLTSCLYPIYEEPGPDGFIESPNPIPDDKIPNPFPGTPPIQPYPNFNTRPESEVNPQQPPSVNDIDESKIPWHPWDKIRPPVNPISIGDELVPINPFVRLPTTPSPIPENGPVGYGGNYEIGYPSEVPPNQGIIGPNFGSNGVIEGGGPYGSPMTPIIPVSGFPQPPYPFDKTEHGQEAKEEVDEKEKITEITTKQSILIDER